MAGKRNAGRSTYVESPAIRKLRIQTWLAQVQKVSGLSVEELEAEFTTRRGRNPARARSCLWDKYRRGEVVPRSGRSASGKLNLVERVEAKYPGTRAWLISPLWRLMDSAAPVDIAEIHQILNAMPTRIRKHVIYPASEQSNGFWRKWGSEEELRKLILSSRQYDDIKCAHVLVREALLTQNREQYDFWNDVTQSLMGSM